MWSGPSTLDSAPEDLLHLWVVKLCVEGGVEAYFYDKLHEHEAHPSNHTMPCEVVHASEGSFMIMPYLRRCGRDIINFAVLLQTYIQILEVRAPVNIVCDSF